MIEIEELKGSYLTELNEALLPYTEASALGKPKKLDTVVRMFDSGGCQVLLLATSSCFVHGDEVTTVRLPVMDFRHHPDRGWRVAQPLSENRSEILDLIGTLRDWHAEHSDHISEDDIEKYVNGAHPSQSRNNLELIARGEQLAEEDDNEFN